MSRFSGGGGPQRGGEVGGRLAEYAELMPPSTTWCWWFWAEGAALVAALKKRCGSSVLSPSGP
jgi:hypothetical protein